MIVTLFFFDVFFTDFYWLIGFLLTDWLSSWLLRCSFSIFYWLLLTDWLFTDWLTFWPKQKGYIGRRTCQNRHRGTQRLFLIDWLTFWLNKLATSEDGLARTATEVHNDNFADQHFSWSAFSWSAFFWSVISWSVFFLIRNSLVSIFPDQHFPDQHFSDQYFPDRHFPDQ